MDSGSRRSSIDPWAETYERLLPPWSWWIILGAIKINSAYAGQAYCENFNKRYMIISTLNTLCDLLIEIFRLKQERYPLENTAYHNWIFSETL